MEKNEPVVGVNRRELIKRVSLMTAGILLGFGNLNRGMAAQTSSSRKTRGSQVAIIIDDIGYNRSLAHRFVALNTNLTFSILPQLPHSKNLAKELHQLGYEIMLHQPMEPYGNGCDPGPGALFVGDNAQRIKQILQANIDGIPFATGVNNHMGSRFTASPNEISTTLKIIRSKKLFFVDSFTSRRSLAHATARRYHMPTAHRNLFLDNIRTEAAIMNQLNHLENLARLHGRAIGIGHPFPQTAKAIGNFARKIKNSKVCMVSVSEIL